MSEDNASFEVELKDNVSRKAKKVAAGFREINKAAGGKGVAAGEKALAKSERAMAARHAKLSGLREKTEAAAFKSQRRRHTQTIAARKEQISSIRKQTQAQSLSSSGGGLPGMGMLGGGAAGLAVGAGVLGAAAGAYAAFETGKATLSAVKFRSESVEGLKLITGSAEEANLVFQRSIALSDKLGLEWQTTVGGMQKLLAKGFDEGFATDLTKGVADLKIVSPDANIDNLLLAIGQIKTAGKLQGDELNQLSEAGLNSALMFKQLEKRLGKSREEVLALKESGKLLADDVLPAILDSIKTMTGKELGSAAEDALDSVAGRMRKLEQLPGRFFLAVTDKLDQTALDSSLKSLLDALDPDSAAFASGVENVAAAVEFAAEAIDVAIPLAKEFGAEFARTFKVFMGFDESGDFLDMWKDPAMLAAVKDFGANLGIIAAALAQILDKGAKVATILGLGIGKEPRVPGASPTSVVADTPQHLLAANPAHMQGVVGAAAAKHMIDGFVNTLFGGTEQARIGGAALASAAEQGMRSRDGADIHSPSKKTEAVADYMTAGLVGNLEAGVGEATKAGQSLGSAPVRGMSSSLPDVSSGSGGGARQSQSVAIGDVILQLSNLPTETTSNPEALARAIRRELQGLFDGLAQQGTIQADS